MTFFQEAVFAIEEFINVRKRMNEFKTDKYFLVRTLGRGEPVENCVLSSFEHPFSHFQNQLFNLTNTREIIDLEKTIVEGLK